VVLIAQLCCCFGVIGVGKRLMPGPAARMAGDQAPVAPGADTLEIGGHLDAAADHRRVHRVVVGVQAHVVVTGQPQRCPPAGRRRDWRQAQHRGAVGVDPVGRGAAQRATMPPVGQAQPAVELGVEVGRAGEAPAGQKRGLQIAVGPLDQALGFRVGRADQHDFGAEHATKPMRGLGQDRDPAAALADRRFLIPDQRPGHPAKPDQQLPQPANRSCADREGSSRALSQRE
jgi:hypothetical protein